MSEKPESPSENEGEKKPSDLTNHPFLQGDVVGADEKHEDYSPVKKGGSGKLVFTLLLLIALGAGGYYYMTLQNEALTEEAPTVTEVPAADAEATEQPVEAVVETATKVAEEVKEAVAEVSEEATEAVVETATEVVEEVKEAVAKVPEEAAETVTEVAETVKSEVEDNVSDIMNGSELTQSLEEKVTVPADVATEAATEETSTEAADVVTSDDEIQWQDGKITDSAQDPPPPANPDSRITIDSTGTTLQVKAPTLSEESKIVVEEKVEEVAKEMQP